MRRSTSVLVWSSVLALALTPFASGVAANSGAATPGHATGAPAVVVAASGTLCVTKFNDLNGDGQRGGAEPTLSGWVFTIRALGGAILGTITTTAAIRTCADVPAATVTVSETLQAGWTPTVPASGSRTVAIAAGQTETVTFGNRQSQTGTLCVTKFNDLNGDGQRGGAEPTLSGWAFVIRDTSGAIVGTITTTAATRTCKDLPAGDYLVSETLQAGWTPTVPAGGSQTVTVMAGQTVTVTFGNRQTRTGALCVTKFNDLDGNGQQGATEPTLSGWMFTIKDPYGTVVGTLTTSAAGTRTCIDLPAGSYTVSETLQAGWTPTVPAGGSQTLTVTAGNTTTVTFGNRQAPTGALILAATSPYMNNNAINWGEYVDLTTTASPGTVFSMQVTTDNITWETLTNSSGSPLSFSIGAAGTSTYRYTPIRNYWYRSVAGPMISNSPRVTVRQTIALRPTHSGTMTISRGTTIAFTATVRPARPELVKAKVVFEAWKKSGSTWVRIQMATRTIDDMGVATWSWGASSSGSFYVRAQAQPTPVNANSFWSPKQYYNVR